MTPLRAWTGGFNGLFFIATVSGRTARILAAFLYASEHQRDLHRHRHRHAIVIVASRRRAPPSFASAPNSAARAYYLAGFDKKSFANADSPQSRFPEIAACRPIRPRTKPANDQPAFGTGPSDTWGLHRCLDETITHKTASSQHTHSSLSPHPDGPLIQ